MKDIHKERLNLLENRIMMMKEETENVYVCLNFLCVCNSSFLNNIWILLCMWILCVNSSILNYYMDSIIYVDLK
jgi:hypothetical protein